MNPNNSRITSPNASSTIVTLTNLKSHLGLYEDSSQDAYLDSILLTAIDRASNYTGYDLEQVERQDLYADFSTTMNLLSRELLNNSIPVITYIATDGSTKTVLASLYTVDLSTDPVSIRLNQGSEWPTDLSQNVANRITISYSSLLNEENAQALIVHAILMDCAEMYRNRENTTRDSVNKLPLSSERLLSNYKKVVV